MSQMESPKTRRLNPFAFPSETDVRFTLLVAAAVTLAFVIMLPFLSTSNLPDVSNLEIDVNSPESIAQGLKEWSRIFVQTAIGLALPSVFALSILILAAIIYRGHPSRLRRRKHLRVLNQSDDPRFADAVQDAIQTSGVSPAPSIELDGALRLGDGQAFGFRNRYAVWLGGGSRLLLRQNAGGFRAILLHELAHIANADVTRTYFAQANWSAFIALTVIPGLSYIAFNFIQGMIVKLQDGLTRADWVTVLTVNLPTIAILLFQFGGTLAIVAAIRSSLLRVREIYADWRAAQWGVETPLSEVLSRAASRDKAGNWSGVWRLHPTPRERLAALKHPERLFQISNELPFFVGALLGYILHGAYYFSLFLLAVLEAGKAVAILQFFNVLGSGLIRIESLLFIASALEVLTVIVVMALGFWVIYQVAGALGLAVQREALADLSAGRRGLTGYLTLWKPAILTAVGFQAGSLLTPLSFLGLLPGLLNLCGLVVGLIIIFSTIGFAIFTWLGLVYVRFFALRALGKHTGASSPHGKRRLLTLGLSVLLLAFYLPAPLTQTIIQGVILGDSSTATFGDTTVSTQLIVILLAGITDAVSLFLYLFGFGATWLMMQAYRLIRPPRCPTCAKATKKPYAVGQICEHCGNELAPWLLISQPR